MSRKENWCLKKNNLINRKISTDCQKAMFPAIIFYSISTFFSGGLGLLMADGLGGFSDAILHLDISSGLSYLWELLTYITFAVFVIPSFETIGELLMSANSLKHDRLVYGKFLDKRFDKVNKMKEGDIQIQMEQDIIDFRCVRVNIAIKAIVSPVILLFWLYNAIKINLIFAILVMVITCLKLFMPTLLKKIDAEYDYQRRLFKSKVRGYETEISNKPHMIKLFGLSKALIEKIQAVFERYYNETYCKEAWFSVIYKNVSAFVERFCYLLVLFIGVIMTSVGSVTSGNVIAMLGYYAVFNTVMGNVGYIIKNRALAVKITERIHSIYMDSESIEGQEFDEMTSIQAKNLSFAYDNEETNVFNDLNFVINRGEKVAIVGGNGTGKTTLLRLLAGLIEGYQGSLKINDFEMSSIQLGKWREKYAYVLQEPYMFEGSVKDNVQLGNLNSTSEEVNKAMSEVGIDYLAERKISMSQNDLSGGEKQKISIARALLKGSSILFIDEPNNNLDLPSMDWLHQLIISSPETIIFISHDKSLTGLADKVINI